MSAAQDWLDERQESWLASLEDPGPQQASRQVKEEPMANDSSKGSSSSSKGSDDWWKQPTPPKPSSGNIGTIGRGK